MAENKTKPMDASVERYLASIADADRRRDCQALARLMSRVTKQKPKMWGSSIVGFGAYHYKYATGREGDSSLTGFSSRKQAITIYLAPYMPQTKAFARLGKHKMGKGCLYIRKLDDVDMQVLEQIIRDSLRELKRRYG